MQKGLLGFRVQGCSTGPCKEGTIGFRVSFPEKGILTKQGTCIMAILGTGILKNFHMGVPFDYGDPNMPPTYYPKPQRLIYLTLGTPKRAHLILGHP